MTTTAPVIGSFADVPLHGERAVRPPTEAAVHKHVAAAASAHSYTPDQLVWQTPEGIDVKPVYIGADRAAIEAAIAERQEARRKRDYKRADAIRAEWSARGVVFEDRPDGSTGWSVTTGRAEDEKI